MKLIRSQAEQSREDYVRGLELNNSDLKKENAALRVRLEQCEALLGLKSHSHRTRPTTSPTSAQVYAQPTSASRRKKKSAAMSSRTGLVHAQGELHERNSCEYTRLVWNDGKLVSTSGMSDLRAWDSGDRNVPNFLKDTYSTQTRKIEKIRWDDYFSSSDEVPNPPIRVNITARVPSTYSSYLADETNLLREPSGPDLSDIYIDNGLSHDLMRRALHLAQDIVWHAFRVYSPETQLLRWPQGPRMVKFGRDELKCIVGEDYGLCSFSGWRETGIELPQVHFCLFSLTRLRNDVAHNQACTTRQIRTSLSYVHQLAVLLHDRPRAEEAGALRDEHENEVQQAFQEIIFGRALPFPHDLALHHQATFNLVNMGYMFSNTPDVVKQAAQDWAVGTGYNGEYEDDHVARCQKQSWTEEDVAFANSMSGLEREFFDSMRLLDVLTAD